MRRDLPPLVWALLLLADALVGCGQPATSTTDGDDPGTTTSGPTTAQTSSAVGTGAETLATTTGEPTQPPMFPVDPCRLEVGVGGGIGLGFPRPLDRLRATGSVRVVVLFAEFPDVSASMTPAQAFELLSPTAVDFIADTSYGALALALDPHLEWLPMSQPSTEYASAIQAFASHRDWLQEAISLADPSVDFSDAELVLLIAAPNADAIAYGPTWIGFDGPGGALEADGAAIKNGITSGADLLSWGGLWLDHELGHSLGLVDSYSFIEPTGFTRPFSLMDLISSDAPEYFAYERWLLGWLDDARVACLPESTTVRLSPIERDEGLAAVMVPLAATRSLVVESRRAIGWDQALSREGAVVYTVDTTVASGEGPIRVLNDQQALGVGDSLSVEGVTIAVLDSSEDGDTVALTLP
ncbi:MAG: hypothetical protein H6713_13685 [Myxococcales bacterium]|nr:hypothetical protein [Myxococcales bacterium]